MRVAFSSMAWNTGSSSPGELEMTCSTSEVAVCCSSDSLRSSVRWRSSLNSRTFSMAITACAANTFSNSSCRFGMEPASAQAPTIAPNGTPSRSIGTASMLRHAPTAACVRS